MLTAAPLTINEGGTLPLAAWQLLDDSTFLAVPATSVTWSVVSGPLTSINASGLATAGIVFQDTAASAQGVYAGNTSPPLALTVLNVNVDDFPGYPGDGIDDAWQVQYFGLPPNANAGPTADVTGTGQKNLFKYIAGLNPVDRTASNAVFRLRIAPAQSESGQRNVVFGPRFTDRTYTVKFTTDLSLANWLPLSSSSFSDNAEERTVTDLGAAGALKFYRVEITKP